MSAGLSAVARRALTLTFTFTIAIAMTVGATPAAAQDRDSIEIARLRAQVEAITRTLEEMQLGREVVVQADTSVYGLGPAASKVYKARPGVSIGGYGEFLYDNFAGERQDGAPSGLDDRLDALRAIVYVGYKFSDRLLFNSEIEFEHGSTENNGSVSLEFAYLDFRFAPSAGVRAGLLLAPMGFLNELHEPPTFLGARRPETERQIIPSTWRENGIGVFGSTGPLDWRAYVINGFDAVGVNSDGEAGFSASGLRDGRQNGSEALANDVGAVGRVDYTGVLGLTIGGSAYVGNSGQGAPLVSDPTRTLAARTTIVEGHAQYRAYGFDLRALAALADQDDVAEINAARGFTGAQSVGERMVGWYVQGGYDVLRGMRSSHQLIPYVRYERLNTQDRVPDGFAADPANDLSILTLGAAWRPIANVAVKADYQVHHNDAETGVNQVSVNVGYLF